MRSIAERRTMSAWREKRFALSRRCRGVGEDGTGSHAFADSGLSTLDSARWLRRVERLPVLSRPPVEVPYHVPVQQRELAHDHLRAVGPRAGCVEEPEFALVHAQHRDIRTGA